MRDLDQNNKRGSKFICLNFDKGGSPVKESSTSRRLQEPTGLESNRKASRRAQRNVSQGSPVSSAVKSGGTLKGRAKIMSPSSHQSGKSGNGSKNTQTKKSNKGVKK